MLVERSSAADSLWPGYTRVSARVVYGDKRIAPDLLWFDVPEQYSAEVSRNGNLWLVALLPLAFRCQEPLQIAAPISATLMKNANATMRIWNRWFPGNKPVAIRAPILSEPEPAGDRTGLFFTGGVDSFFSLFHFDEKIRSNGSDGTRPIDDVIYVCGFDIPLANGPALAGKIRKLGDVARAIGKNLIVIASNLRETRLGSLEWDVVMCGPGLGAAGLLLERRFGKLLISAGGSGLDDVTPWGSHPLTDPLLSTDRLEFIRYENKPRRFAKTEYIAQLEIAIRNLHVCWEDRSDLNCGRCEKCYRTLAALEVLGVRDKASSFPGGTFSVGRLGTLQLKSSVCVTLMEELKASALKRGRVDIATAVDLCITRKRQREASVPAAFRRFKERVRKARKSFWRELNLLVRPPSQA
jgi:hypothetical protein